MRKNEREFAIPYPRSSESCFTIEITTTRPYDPCGGAAAVRVYGAAEEKYFRWLYLFRDFVLCGSFADQEPYLTKGGYEAG